MKRFYIMLIGLLLFSQILSAGDRKNTPVSWVEGTTFISYADSARYSATDSTDNLYTQAFWVGDLDLSTAQVVCWMSNSAAGTEDVNVYIQFSNFPARKVSSNNYQSVTDSSFLAGVALIDNQTVAVKVDTIGVKSGTTIDNALWARLYFDGQAGNPQTTIHWSFIADKKTGAPDDDVAGAVKTSTQ